MTRSHIRLIIAVVLLVPFSVAILWAQTKSNTADADSAAIKQAIAEWSDAFNRHDGHSAAMSFTEDASYTTTRGLTIRGRKEIEEHFSNFTGINKNAHRTDTVKNIRLLTPEIASVLSDWEMTGRPDVPFRKGLIDWVMTKQSGHWVVAVFHESELTSAPTK